MPMVVSQLVLQWQLVAAWCGLPGALLAPVCLLHSLSWSLVGQSLKVSLLPCCCWSHVLPLLLAA